jgi:hypothetical protein
MRSLDQSPLLILDRDVNRDLGRHPRSCLWCRDVEPNDFLEGNNHYAPMGWRVGHCVAQGLTRNHVTFAVTRLEKGGRDRHGNIKPLSTDGRESEVTSLARYIKRAEQLWGHRDDTEWLDEARQILARETQPRRPLEHHDVAVGDQLDLFGAAS